MRLNGLSSTLSKLIMILVFSMLYGITSAQSVVQVNGLLKVNGNQVVNKDNNPVSLAGNSFFWSNNGWGGERFYTPQVVAWLKKDWNTSIVRAAMGVDDGGGYLEDKTRNVARVKTIVDAAIAQGIYVIIDWHSHHAENYTVEAVAFFKEMAQLYGNKPNVIYEIYNEPLAVSWSATIKPYAEEVIAAIREIDPDNLIIVGTAEWSQKVDEPANDPITDYDNIAYTLHFYTVHHKQWLRDRASAAMAKGIALFVTEWGSLGYTQNDPETDAWMKWCLDNNISHCSWSINDKKEEWSILKTGAATVGGWKDSYLTEAGLLSKRIIKYWGQDLSTLATEDVTIASSDLNIFPNPTIDKITIKNIQAGAGMLDVKVYTIHGKLVQYKQMLADGEYISIKTDDLRPGSYVLTISNALTTKQAHFVKE